jgi:outer membrane protein assembly factor BamB
MKSVSVALFAAAMLLSEYSAGLVWGGEFWPSFQNGGLVSLGSEKSQSIKPADAIQWTAELSGYGQSSPVVWNGHVYVTTTEGDNKDQCHVSAIRISDGTQVWRHTTANASPQESSTYVSRAAPTPAADADGLICFFEGGNVVALTHEGKLRWERNLVDDYGPVTARHGLSASVEQNSDSAFVWVERGEEPYIVSLNKQTGETQWKAEGLGATSWASPRLVPVGDGQHLVLSAIGSIVGLDPASGERLWTLSEIAGNSTPTPMPLGNGRFLMGATVGRGESGGGRAADFNGVIEIAQGADGAWTADYVWRAQRATSSFGSPMAHNGVAYFVNREGVLYGLDLETGEELVAKRLKGSCWATPIGIGNQVFFFGKDKQIDVLSDPGESWTVSSWSPLPDDAAGTDEKAAEGGSQNSGSVLYAATLCADSLLIRCGERLYCIATQPGS